MIDVFHYMGGKRVRFKIRPLPDQWIFRRKVILQ